MFNFFLIMMKINNTQWAEMLVAYKKHYKFSKKTP
jgi:hypothetical protein